MVCLYDGHGSSFQFALSRIVKGVSGCWYIKSEWNKFGKGGGIERERLALFVSLLPKFFWLSGKCFLYFWGHVATHAHEVFYYLVSFIFIIRLLASTLSKQ